MAEEKKIVLSIETITDQAVMEAYGQVLNDVLGSYEDNIALIAQYNAQMKENQARIKEIEKATETYGRTTKKQAEELARLTAENAKLKQAKAELVEITKNQEKIDTTQAGTMENQSQLLGKLREAWRAMTDEQKAANQGMLETIQQLDAGLKRSDAEIGNFQRNVGNYAGGIVQALGRLNILPGKVATYVSAVARLDADFKSVAGVVRGSVVPSIGALIKSMGVLKTAILATGVGALVVGLGALITKCVEVFELFGEGGQSNNFSDYLQRINDELERFNTLLNQENKQEDLKALEELRDGLKDVGIHASDASFKLDKFNESVSKNNRILLRNQRKGLRQTIKEIEDAYAKWEAIPGNRGKTNADFENQLATKRAELADVEIQLLSYVQSSAKVIADTESKIFTHSLSERGKELYKLSQEQIKVVEAYELVGRDVTKVNEYYNKRRAEINEKYDKKERDAREKAAQEREKRAKAIEKSITDSLKQGLDERKDLVKEGRDAIKDEMKASVDDAKDFFKDELEAMNEEIANDPALNKVAESPFARALGVTDEEVIRIKDQALSAAQNIFGSISQLSKEATQRRLEDELNAVDREADSEKDILKAKLEKGIISQKEYEKKLGELDEETAARKEELNKEAFQKQKAWNIGQALMNAALAITKTFAEYGGTPLAFITAAITAATTAAEIGVIASQKYARGGELHGASHANGGIKGFVGNRHIEAEGGEIIINKRSSAKHRKLLSLINSDNGWGDDFANARGGSGRFFARGGVLGGYDFRTSALPDTRGGLAQFAKQQTANIENAISALNKRIDNIRVYLPLSDIEQKSNEKRVHVSRAVL